MRVEVGEPCPLPDDPVLAEWAVAMRESGDWGWILDSSWRLRFMTDELRLSFAADVEMVPVVIGEHLFGREMSAVRAQWRNGPPDETLRKLLDGVGASCEPQGGAMRSMSADEALAPVAAEPSCRSGRTGIEQAIAELQCACPIRLQNATRRASSTSTT